MLHQAEKDLSAIEKRVKENKTIFFESKFNFLLEHYGYRPGCLHALLGTPGGGKTSLLKAMISEATIKKKVLLMLTEEQFKEYEPDLHASNENYNPDNLLYMHEDSVPTEIKKDKKAALNYLRDQVNDSDCDVFFFDNITTSVFYASTSGLRWQEELISMLRRTAKTLNIPIIYAVHTNKNVKDNSNKLIDGEDVRGTNQSFQKSDYFYVLQRFQQENNYYPFLFLRKHRFHKFVDNKYFYLNFKNGCYEEDKPTTFDKINQAFMQRNWLGKADKKK